MVDGLIIPRTYNDYFSRSDPAAIRQLVAQFTDAALSATSENPVQNKVVKAALDVINAVIPTGASASDKLALESSIDAIDAKIPTQASAQNQLADKEFVNSSVSTNTANYISNNGEPFASVAALEAYSGTVTNNDYAFVTGTDAAGNVYYDRYKATVSGASVSWAKEYRLNNSSFTAAQWAAITSGITAAKVAQYDAGVTPVDEVTLNNMHSVTSNAVAARFNKLDYSLDEVNTGIKWIDGKNIYRKVVNFGNLPNNTSKWLNHNISNFEYLVNAIMFSTVGTSFYPIPYVSLGARGVAMQVSTTAVMVQTGTDQSNEKAYIILEYTKTTD